MKATVIACSQCNWQRLDDFTDKTLGEKVSTRLRGTILSPDDQASYPAVLGHTDPLFNLRRGHKYTKTFEHGFMTLGLEADDSTILRLAIEGFRLASLKSNVVLVSASYSFWFERIVAGLRGPDSEYEEFLTYTCLIMENIGFRQMFAGLERKVSNGIIVFKGGENNVH